MARTNQEVLPAVDQVCLEVLQRRRAKWNDSQALTAQDVHGRGLPDNTHQTAGQMDTTSSDIIDRHELITGVARHVKVLQESLQAWTVRHNDLDLLGVPLLCHLYDQIRVIIMSKTTDAEGRVPFKWMDRQYAQTAIEQFAGEIRSEMERIEISIMTPSELERKIWGAQNVSLRKDANLTLVPIFSQHDVIVFNRLLNDVPDAKSWCVPVTFALSDEHLRALKAKCDAVISFNEEQQEDLQMLLCGLKSIKDEGEAGVTVPSPAEMTMRYDDIYASFKGYLHRQTTVCATAQNTVTDISELLESEMWKKVKSEKQLIEILKDLNIRLEFVIGKQNDNTDGSIRLPPGCYGHESLPPGTAPMGPADDTQTRGAPVVISPHSRSAIPRSAKQRMDDVIRQGDGESPSDDRPSTKITLDREFELRDQPKINTGRCS